MQPRFPIKIPQRLMLFGLSLCLSAQACSAFGQEKINALPSPVQPATTVAPPAGPLTLEECIQLGMENQPALAAARASLAAAQTGQYSLSRLVIPRLFTPDLGQRQQQACLGVTIAQASLEQKEWETRYAITRNFFTVQYVRLQRVVVEDSMLNLNKSTKRAKFLFDKGDPDVPISQFDLDALDIQLAMLQTKKAQVDNGMLKALAALREAIGVCHDYALNIVVADLPPVVYAFDKEQLIASALANRGEMVQANAANRVTELEIDAQGRSRGWKKSTFAAGADIHAKQVPQGIFNNEYRPEATGPEMPGMLVGRKSDRVQRAANLNDRSIAVVAKTNNLIELDVEAQYLKWQEAVETIRSLSRVSARAQELPGKLLERANLNVKDFTGGAIIQSNITAATIRSQLNEALHMHALALAGLERATAGAFQIYPVPASAPALPTKK